MTNPLLTVIDTGTRAPKKIPKNISLRHIPALIRRPLPLDLNTLQQTLRPKSHLFFYSPFSAQLIVDTGLLDPARHQLWAVGDHTAQILKQALGADVNIPNIQDFEGLKDLLAKGAEPLPLIALGLKDQPRDLSPFATAWGVAFTELPVYESAPNDLDTLLQAFDEAPPDWITLTSSRGARAIINHLGKARLRTTHLAAIGQPTAQTLKKHDLQAALIPKKPCRETLLEAIAAFIP